MSLLSVLNICGCPCPQVLAVVPAWLSRSQPQTVQGASSGCQVSVPGCGLGIFPAFRHFMRKLNVGHGCEMGKKKIWGEDGLGGNRAGIFPAWQGLHWDGKNETGRGMTMTRTAKTGGSSCTWPEHAVNQALSPRGDPEPRGRCGQHPCSSGMFWSPAGSVPCH